MNPSALVTYSKQWPESQRARERTGTRTGDLAAPDPLERGRRIGPETVLGDADVVVVSCTNDALP